MRALAFGEILWDISSSGRTLGGAPLNVAGHIVRLGGQAMIVSALGNDSLGNDAAAALDGLGVDSSLVHRSSCATGYAEILLEDGIPSYRFNDPAAWDDIWLSEEELDRLSSLSFDAVIYGTLACRHERSRTTLFRLLDRIRSRDFFFDVNIRLSFYTDDLIRAGLESVVCLEKASMVADYVVARQAAIPEYDSVLMRSLGL